MAGQRKYTILVVEDEALMLRVLKTLLEHEQFNVLAARDGEEAVAIYEQRKDEIALVLSDIMLPKMDGWAVFARLRASNPEVKVIFTSGSFTPDICDQCEEQGVLGFISKPFKLEEVIDRIRSALLLKEH